LYQGTTLEAAEKSDLVGYFAVFLG
jgi:hypothetical protein